MFRSGNRMLLPLGNDALWVALLQQGHRVPRCIPRGMRLSGGDDPVRDGYVADMLSGRPSVHLRVHPGVELLDEHGMRVEQQSVILLQLVVEFIFVVELVFFFVVELIHDGVRVQAIRSDVRPRSRLLCQPPRPDDTDLRHLHQQRVLLVGGLCVRRHHHMLRQLDVPKRDLSVSSRGYTLRNTRRR